MFVQIIQGKVRDRDGLLATIEKLRHRPDQPIGWLGTTAGVADDGELFVAARFESADAARRNSERPEQDAWWREFSRHLDGAATFHDCDQAETFGGGGSDDAGFVQVIQARGDVAALRTMMEEEGPQLQQQRPDVIGGLIADHGDGSFTQIIYFTNEEEAREGERRMNEQEGGGVDDRMAGAMSDVRYIDLRDPYLASP